MWADSIKDTETVTIAGAGLGGSLMAVYLARAGFKVEVFERWSDPRRSDVPAGRSINLALAERGIHALKTVGLHHRIAPMALPMKGRMVHTSDGETQLQPYGTRDDEVIYSVHRAKLNLALINAAEATDRVRIHFNQELLGIDFDQGLARFRDHASNRVYERHVLPLIGADGAGSEVRQAIDRHLDTTSVSDLLDHGYLELTIPAGPDGGYRIDPEALHIWARGGFMMIALPNADGSFTVTLFMANNGDPGFKQLDTFDKFHRFIASEFADVLPHLINIESDYAANPIGILGTVRCPEWHVDGQSLVIGDAAHAIVPFHGQGMNCAFEDCEVLARLIDECDTWSATFARFQQERQPDAHAIAEMALENYVEMRAGVIDPKYRLKRQLALELESRFPNHFVPRYNLVMFRRMRYSRVFERGRINAAILEELTAKASSIEQIDWDRASSLLRELLPKVPSKVESSAASW